jgi:beta-lactamase regulating signal transducer with metallopeptidase domain/predicted transcriptional regulator
MHFDTPITAIILDTLAKATLLLTFTWCATLALRKRSAASRHMVHVFSLAALLLLPVFVLVTPEWRVTGVPSFAAKPELAEPTPAVQGPVSAKVAVPQTQATQQQSPQVKTRRHTTVATNRTHIPQPEHQPVTGIHEEHAAAAPAQTRFAERSVWRSYIPGALAVLWILGSLLVLLRWRRNASRVAALVRRATVLTHSGWNAEIRALARDMGLEREVVLMASRELEIPITTGSVIPRIILPLEHPEWSATRRSAILKHELAHIKRLDTLTHAVAQLAAAMYWFHPLVWLTVRSIRAERERACDDQVLAGGMKASDYAHELLDIVSGLREPELAAALAMARRSQLEGRVLAVLNPALPRGAVSPKAALAVATLTLAVAVPLAALHGAAQASAPSPKQSTAVKPSPATTPQASAGKPAPAAPQASTTARVSDEDAEAPEPPEVPDVPDVPEVPEAADPGIPAVPGVQGVPAVPAVPAVPGVPAVPSVPAVPAVPAVPSVAGGDLSLCGTRAKLHNMNIESHDGKYRKWTATWAGDDCSLDLRAEGEIKFNAEATEIQSISSGGYFEVNLRQGSSLKQVRVTPSNNGLQYVYKLNGTQQPFEGDARTWFSQFLLQLERTTGFAADARVPALLAKGGPTAVLDEISNLQSDYVRGRYFRKLLEQPNLSGPIVIRVIKQSSEQIHSDYELARVLMTVGKQYDLADEQSRTAFLTATNKLSSDYEHSRVLIELLRRPNISKENVRLALGSAASLKSDYEKSRVLLSLMDQKAFDQSEVDPYLKLVSTIQSDYEKSRDLLAPMQRYRLTPEQVNQIMGAAAGMSSDYEKSRLLLGLAKQGKFDEAQMSNYLKVVDSMHSDYERSRSLLELMQNNTLSPASTSRAMENISKASSDYEKSRVLTTLVKANKFDESQMGTYLKVMDSMSSDYERSRCLLALMEQNKLSTASIGKVIDATRGIKSDYEKSRVLQTVAQGYQLDGALRDSYIKAANSISTEYERNRALAAVVKRATL